MNPQWDFTIERAVESPSPLPRPTPFVVKKGSKIWPLRMSGIPHPESEMSIRMKAPGTASGWGRGAEGDTRAGVAEIASRPPEGMASLAFTQRFRSILVQLDRVPGDGVEPGGDLEVDLDVLGEGAVEEGS